MNARPCPVRPRAAFTIVELLAVITIIAALMTFAVMAIQSQGRGRNLVKAGYDLAGVLEQARHHAMAANTHAWVGLRELSDGTLETVTVASRNGDDRPAGNDTALAGSGLVQVGGVMKWANTKIVALPASPDRPAAASLAEAESPLYPFYTGAGAGRREFTQYVIGFNSRGEAALASGTLQRVIEIGLQSAANGTVQNPDDFIAVQIAGLSGHVEVHQP